MKAISDIDKQNMLDELNEMRIVKAWLMKRAEAEIDVRCKAMLVDAIYYVDSSIEAFSRDLKFFENLDKLLRNCSCNMTRPGDIHAENAVHQET